MASWESSLPISVVARSVFYYSASSTLGGAEQALFRLIGGLDRAEWSPTLLLSDAAGADQLAAEAADSVPVLRVPPMPLGLRGATGIPRMVRVLREHRPDVFHAHLSSPVDAKFALAAAIAARVRAIVATVQLVGPLDLDRSTRLQLRAVAAGVDRYIAVSRDIAGQLTDRFGYPARKVSVVYNAAEARPPAAGRRAAVREELGVEERPLILTPARLEDQKGHKPLLRVVADVPEAVFVFAGTGSLRAELEALAGELAVADRVVFLGHREDVADLLAACDVVALPSLYEGSSLAILEAMAASRPVVASRIPGTDELITDEQNGLLVPPGDPAALAAALRRVLSEEGLGEALAEAARARFERDFTLDVVAARTQAVYRELLEPGP
jgi:glycosyltransferase involved in cell wall biosynthesis